jgi:hypothetical protein
MPDAELKSTSDFMGALDCFSTMRKAVKFITKSATLPSLLEVKFREAVSGR